VPPPTFSSWTNWRQAARRENFGSAANADRVACGITGPGSFQRGGADFFVANGSIWLLKSRVKRPNKLTMQNLSVPVHRFPREGNRLLLARHAETSAPDRFHGAESDIGLSEWGGRQAELLGQSLREVGATALYSSAMRRAIATAAPIGLACGLEPVAIPALHERKIGPLSGLSREDGWATYAASKERWAAGDLDHTHIGGESYADIRRRILPIFGELTRRHQGETVIVVAHGVLIRVFLTTFVSGFQPADFDRIAIDFASVNDLVFDGMTWNAVSLNQCVAPSPARPVA
jgi:2,3-bisphosphoglycerate-dependent phosphoglycerate mutase